MVLIHGYPLSSGSWKKQVGALREAGHRVITYDRRGFGKSSQPVDGYDYDTFTEDLHQVVTQLNLIDVALVGFSMGSGEVARYFFKYGSDGVRRVILISSVPPFQWKASDDIAGVASGGLQQIVTADRAAFFAGFFKNCYNPDLLMSESVREMMARASWEAAAACSVTAALGCVASWFEDFSEDIDCIDVPALIIHGDTDRIAPIGDSGPRTAERIASSRLVVVKDGSHGLIWTHAEEVNRELVDFLAEGAGMSASGTLRSDAIA